MISKYWGQLENDFLQRKFISQIMAGPTLTMTSAENIKLIEELYVFVSDDTSRKYKKILREPEIRWHSAIS